MEHGSSPAPAFVGVNVSKHRLDVHVRPANSALSFARDAGGISALAGHLASFPVALVALEATRVVARTHLVARRSSLA
jgi:transposase